MRIRFKPWARQELEESSFYIDNPQDYKNKWRSLYKNEGPLYVELGCGKGGFAAQIASENKNINYLAIDLVDAMLGLAKRKIEETYTEKNKEIDNIYITRYDIERINNMLGKEDKVDRIYINFCNPWPRGKHHKKRLTHTRQLMKYREFLTRGGELFFKTDDDDLFEDTIKYLEESGFEIFNKTYDLTGLDILKENTLSEHEQMFIEQGKKIKALKARKIDVHEKDFEDEKCA